MRIDKTAYDVFRLGPLDGARRNLCNPKFHFIVSCPNKVAAEQEIAKLLSQFSHGCYYILPRYTSLG